MLDSSSDGDVAHAAPAPTPRPSDSQSRPLTWVAKRRLKREKVTEPGLCDMGCKEKVASIASNECHDAVPPVEVASSKRVRGSTLQLTSHHQPLNYESVSWWRNPLLSHFEKDRRGLGKQARQLSVASACSAFCGEALVLEAIAMVLDSVLPNGCKCLSMFISMIYL